MSKRTSKTVGRVLSIVIVFLSLTGCATVFKGTKSDIDFYTEPAGAKVFANGRLVGTTPLETELESKQTYSIEFKKEGYQTKTLMVSNGVSAGWVILDFVLGVWPILVDGITGAWYGFDESEVHAVLEPGSGAVAEAPPPRATGGGGPGFKGERRRIKSGTVKCAAMPMKKAGVDENLSTVLDDVLLSELQQAGFEAIGPDDINAMLGFERTKEAVGCDDAACIAEIGGALGVDYLVAGKVATVSGSPIVTLKLMDVRKGHVLARSNRSTSAGEGAVVGLIAEAVQELVARSKL
ncbi:PEGA domain-containing protein [Myxococcota bacterium]